MLLTITTTHRPATDLGFLLHKHPGKCQSFHLSFGEAHVAYPEASEERCTAALVLDVDPVALVRDRRGPPGEGRALEQYVNDRPYVASSFLSVAIAQVFGTALSGRSAGRQELAESAIPLTAAISVVRARGGERLLRRLFEPLGYEVALERLPLDARFPEWQESPYFHLRLAAQASLRDLLRHVYVLIPVLDDDKHYWIGEDEVEKLFRHAGDWLPGHPEREEIVERYLRRRPRLARAALARLLDEDQDDPDDEAAAHEEEEAAIEEPVRLNDARLGVVLSVIRESEAKRVLDLGCGEGRLVQALLKLKEIQEVVGIDVSPRALEIAARRLKLDRLPAKARARVRLLQGSLLYRDRRLAGFDAAAVVEVIEHLDPPRLAAFERVLFEFARPRLVVLTTPNAEYNARFAELPAGRFRHQDHRFEWTRDEFRAWAKAVHRRFSYGVRFLSVGPEDLDLGPPTQLAVFTRHEDHGS